MASFVKRTRFSTQKCLENFLCWCETNGFNMNCKIEVKEANRSVAIAGGSEYGIFATKSLTKGEELFRIPRHVLIHPQTSYISTFLEINKEILKSDSGWVPLLIALMYEYTFPDSLWRWYLDLCIDHHKFNLPMFWSHEQLQQLKGTGVIEVVNCDLKNIENEFSKIVFPFMKNNLKVFDERHTLELYKKMVAFVMSYSFTEPADNPSTSHPMMVPMADMLNHASNNNACLQFDKDCLKMVTTREITGGEEVLNTYGELANWQLLHMYGFAEQPSENVFDVVEFTSTDVFEQARSLKDLNIELIDEKMFFIGTDVFAVGNEGIITADEIYLTLKILFMSADAFTIYKKSDGWESDDEVDDINLSFDQVKHLPHPWRRLLASVARQCLRRYSIPNKEDIKMKDSEMIFSLYVGYVKDGQTKILQKLIDSL